MSIRTRLTLGLILASSMSVRAAERAEAYLAEKGLQRIGKSNVWGFRDEERLRRRIERLAKRKQAMGRIEIYLAQRVAQNRRDWAALQQVEAAMRQLPSSLPANAPQRKQLQQQEQLLRSRSVAPNQLGGVADVQAQLIQLTNHRNEIALCWLSARSLLPQLAERYRTLPDAVDQAIGELGGNHRLGPVVAFEKDLATLAEYESLAFNSTLPLYRQSGQLRIGGIINDETPVTFTWEDSREHTVITSNIAESAGLEVRNDAPRAVLAFGRRKLPATRMTIDYLRFGEHVLSNVVVYVLPPEGEDLGARIGRNAFADLQVEARPTALQFTIKLGE